MTDQEYNIVDNEFDEEDEDEWFQLETSEIKGRVTSNTRREVIDERFEKEFLVLGFDNGQEAELKISKAATGIRPTCAAGKLMAVIQNQTGRVIKKRSDFNGIWLHMRQIEQSFIRRETGEEIKYTEWGAISAHLSEPEEWPEGTDTEAADAVTTENINALKERVQTYLADNGESGTNKDQLRAFTDSSPHLERVIEELTADGAIYEGGPNLFFTV